MLAVAAIYRKKNRKYYYAFFRVPSPGGGWRQVHRCTKKLTKKEAEDAARQMEKAARDAAGAGDEKSQAIYEVLRRASEVAVKGLLNHDRGRDFINEMMVIALGPGEGVVEWSVRAWVKTWLASKRVTAKPATMHRYDHALGEFLSFLGETRADARMETLSVADVQGFRDSLRNQAGRKRVAKTVNGYVKDIGACLRAAVREGVLARSPAERVTSLPEDDSVERLPFTMEEARLLMASAPSSDWKGVILLGLYGGLRLGDAARLKAGNVDLLAGVLRYLPAKTSRKKKVVTLPLHPTLAEFFEGHPTRDKEEEPLFPSLAHLTVSGRNGLSLAFSRILDASGVPRKVLRASEDGAARNTYDRSFHSLRHTFNSLMAAADVSQEVRMKLTGHSTREVNDLYTHAETETLRKAVEALPPL